MLQQIYPQVQHPYRYELNKDMHFAAAHYVPHESAGICQNTHGHTYFVNITVAGDELNAAGFLVNFKVLKELIHKRYDHTVMNDHDEFDIAAAEGGHIPSTEIVAHAVWLRIQAYLDTLNHKPVCPQVFVRETPSSYVIFRPQKDDFDLVRSERGIQEWR